MAGSWQEALGEARLVVSGFGTFGGGLYDVTTGVAEALDDLSSAGLAVGGDRLWRLLRAPGEHTGTCELLSYDEVGVCSYQRIDAVRDPHDVCFHDGAAHITSSWDNAVWRVSAKGKSRRVWQGSTVVDSWHPNSLLVHDGVLHVCAFGRFDRHKGWRADAHRGQGFVAPIDGGEPVLAGLDAPHDPRPVGGGWFVCESSTGVLTEFAPDRTRRRSIAIGHYARGLALVGGFAFVGVSAHRDLEDRRAELVVVDLEAGEVAERLPLPCLEIYAVLPVPAPLVAGVRRGFATNAARVAEQVHRAAWQPELQPTPRPRAVALASTAEADLLAGAGAAHEVSALRGAVHVDQLPDKIGAGEQFVVAVDIENLSDFPFVTVPPHKVGVAPRWFPTDGDGTEGAPEVGMLSPLPRRVDPGGRDRVAVVVDAPATPGGYRLSIALQQLGVAWFGLRHDAPVEVVVDLGDEAASAQSVTD